jgi:hypothetical protein
MIVMVASGVVLTIRSILHAQAGLRGVLAPGSDRATIATSRYTTFGVASSFIVGALIFMLAMTAGGMGILLIVFIAIFVGLLLVWPLTLKRFFSERSSAAMMSADGTASFVRGPDSGMVGLGWLLLGLAVLGLSFQVPVLLSGGAGGLLGKVMPISMTAPAVDSTGEYLNLGISLLQLWAAIELISMSGRWKAATFTYSIAGIGVAVYAVLPLLKGMGGNVEGMAGGFVPSSLQVVGPLTAALVFPLGTLLLALRRTITSGVRASA